MRLFAAALVGAFALSAGGAVACSCLLPASAEAHLDQSQAELVFTGRVLRTKVSRDGTAATTFRPVEVWRGRAGRTVVVRHAIDGAACGVTFAPGRTTLVLADRDGLSAPARGWRRLERRGVPLRTSLCSRPWFPLADYRRALVSAAH